MASATKHGKQATGAATHANKANQTSNVHNTKQHGHKDNNENYSRIGRPTGSSRDPGRDCDSSRPDGCGGYAFIILASVAGTAGGCCGGGFGVVEFA